MSCMGKIVVFKLVFNMIVLGKFLSLPMKSKPTITVSSIYLLLMGNDIDFVKNIPVTFPVECPWGADSRPRKFYHSYINIIQLY